MVIYYRGIKPNKPVNPNLYLHAYELRVQHVPYLTLDLRDLAEKFTGLTFKVEFDLSQNRERKCYTRYSSHPRRTRFSTVGYAWRPTYVPLEPTKEKKKGPQSGSLEAAGLEQVGVLQVSFGGLKSECIPRRMAWRK